MAHKPWKIIPRPLFETILNNHVHHPRVPQPLILHGPRGVGKTTLILERLLDDWNKGPHITGYVDFAESIKDHHPQYDHSFPWTSWSNCPPPTLSHCRKTLENCLESMAQKGVMLGAITSHQVFTTLNKSHGLNTALKRVLQGSVGLKCEVSNRISMARLWDHAVFAVSDRCGDGEVGGILGLSEKGGGFLCVEEAAYFKEALAALRLAKEVIEVQLSWRGDAIANLNRTGGFSRSLAHSCTDWPCLLLELLSQAAEIDHFQPKLVINNVEVLKHATLSDELSVSGPLYHDSLIWRIIALGVNVRSLPVILVTSDSYYSYKAFLDFGFIDIFVSRETFGWTPAEAKMHMVADYFSHSEWTIVAELLGSSPRHLFELYVLKQSNYFQKDTGDKSTFEDILDAYLAYLQIAVVNPAMDRALDILQKFAVDVRAGKVSKDKLRFGAPWRHPPRTDDPTSNVEWAKLQLMDFVQSLVNTEFGFNYLADCSLEIFDDPSATALLEVGLIYAQRDPSFMRPISRGIQRCLVRWLVQQRMELSFPNLMYFLWHRIIRGRSYRHLMLEIGYK